MNKLGHERRIVLISLAAGVPAVIATLALLAIGPYSLLVKTSVAAGVLTFWLYLTNQVRRQTARPLQTIANLLAALREGDFSIRARGADAGDALATVMRELNDLSSTLKRQRLDATEATALLRAVMTEIDVAIFALDRAGRIVLVNRYGERLLARQSADLIGSSLDDVLQQSAHPLSGVVDISFPGGTGRWEVRRRTFWQDGQPHELLVLADVSQALREQERQAWQGLIRVIGHELNNSLAPIKSIAGSLRRLIDRQPLPEDWQDDTRRGLDILASRADALGRFTAASSQLARLPPPRPRPVDWGTLIRRVAQLELRLPVAITAGADLAVNADGDQLEQLLINLTRNAVDAALEVGGGVTIGWSISNGMLETWVEDDGPGVQSTHNLFVPFFTTKQGGSGIGLVLSRQIAEAHGGTLTLENRNDARGARATLRLPVAG